MDGRTILHFGAVDYSARVWVNGHLVAEHEGGHTPFSADITGALNADGKQVVTVCVEDDPHDLAKPRGKQDWLLEPHSIWYPRTTGIWQTVWLEQVAATYIQKLRWTPDVRDLRDRLRGVRHRRHPGRPVCRGQDLAWRHSCWPTTTTSCSDSEANRKIALSDPGIDDSRNELLWSPERPTLLDAEVTLRAGDVVLDRIRSYTALRSVAINRDRFMLNGRPYQLRLVLDQGYWPDIVHDGAVRRRT